MRKARTAGTRALISKPDTCRRAIASHFHVVSPNSQQLTYINMTCGGSCCGPAPPLQAASDSSSGLPPSSGRPDSDQLVLPPVAGPPSMSPVPPNDMPPAGRPPSSMAESDVQVESKGPPSDHTSLPDPNDAAGRRRVSLSVIGMDCPSCAPRVVRALTSLPSVADCQVDIFAARAVVTYHPSQVQVDEMPRRVTTETGFRCQVIQDSPVEQAQDDSKRMKIHVERPQVKYPEMDGVRVVSHQGKELELEYDARLNPRDVLAFFESYSPTYVAPPQALSADSAQRQVLHLLRLTLISAVLCIPVLVVAWAPLPPNPTAYGGTSLALTTLIQLLVARPIYMSGLRALIVQRTIDMDLLVSISTGTAYVFSTVAYTCSVAGEPIGNDDETYFETAALLVTLVMFGRLIAAYARRRSTNAVVELSSMQSLQATLVDPATGMTSVIPMGLVHVGDVLRIASGECVPTDGRVIQGEAYADESSITGESVPVFKRPGAVLVAGTRLIPHTPLGPAQNQTSQADNNEAGKECCQKGSCCGPTNSLQDGSLDMRVTLSPDSNTLSRMVELLRTAQGARLRVQDTADRVSGYLAPVVLVIATVVLCAWIGVGVSNARKLADSVARSTARREAVVAAIGYTVAVLVVSCPCAIALCVPMVAVIAVAVGTKRGVLFKTVEALETTTSVEVVVFDKTGTLTLGKLAVETSAYYPQESGSVWWLGSEEGIQGVVRALTDSMHPVSVAVHEHVITLLASTSDSDRTLNVRNFPGQGVEATVDGVTVRGGSAAWANVQGMGGESTVFVVSISTDPANSKWTCIARYTLSDSLRPDALATIRTLSARGLEVHILSGDTQAVVARTAASLGIPTSQARGGCSPEDKAQWIKFIQMGGQECETGCCGSEAKERVRARKVMFIGDGTNDALALVQSNVGVSLGGGTDVASSAAQIVLISSLGTGLSNVFTLSRAAQRRIWINFIWAGVYNTSAILFASGVLGEVRIPPQFAGLGELVSVLPVIAVGWSLGVGSW